MTTGKTIALTIWMFVNKVMSLLCNTLTTFVIIFLLRCKCLLISWLQSAPTVILEHKKKICHCFHFFLLYVPWSDVMVAIAMIFIFLILNFKTSFHSSLSRSSRGSLVPLGFLPLKWYHLHIWSCWYFSWKSWFQLVIHPAQHFTWCTLQIIWISRMTIFSLVVFLSQFWTSQLFHVWF